MENQYVEIVIEETVCFIRLGDHPISVYGSPANDCRLALCHVYQLIHPSAVERLMPQAKRGMNRLVSKVSQECWPNSSCMWKGLQLIVTNTMTMRSG